MLMAASSSPAQKGNEEARGFAKGQMTALDDTIQAHAASTDISVISAADAKSMAGFKPGLDKFASELCAAEGRGFFQCRVRQAHHHHDRSAC